MELSFRFHSKTSDAASIANRASTDSRVPLCERRVPPAGALFEGGWIWRIPFLMSFVMAAIGIFVRMSVSESTEFEAVKTENKVMKQPALEVNKNDWHSILKIVGLRIAKTGAAARLRDTSRQIAGLPWHLQADARLPVLEALKQQLAEVPVPLVLDHFAGLDAAASLDQPGFATVIELLRSGHIYVKISSPYYSSRNSRIHRHSAFRTRARCCKTGEGSTGQPLAASRKRASSGRKPTDPASPQVSTTDLASSAARNGCRTRHSASSFW
jgi:hypothetical protein